MNADFVINIKNLESQISESWQIRRSNPLEALRLAMESIQMSNDLNSQEHLASAHRNAGTAFYLLSQYTTGLEHLLKSKQLFEIVNNKKGLADVLRNIGNIYHSSNQYDEANDLYDEAKKLCIEIGDKQGEAYNLGNIGYVKLLQNQFDNAIIYIYEALTILEEIEDTLGLADALNNLGRAYFGKTNLSKSLDLFLLSLKKAKEIDHLRGIANGNISLGNFHLKEKNYELTQNYLVDALSSAEKLGEVALIVSVYKQLSDLFEAKTEYDKALNYYKQYEQLKSKNEKENNKQLINSLKYQFSFEQLELEKNILEQKNNELSIANELINTKNIELELLSLVASHTDNIIIIYDENYRLEWLNNSFIKYTGTDYSNDILSKKPTIFEMSGNTSIKNIVDESITKKEPIKYDSSFVNERNETKWFSSTLSPIFDETGVLKKLVIIDADITEIKRTGDILNQKNKDITDSINYALKIQSSLLPDKTDFEKLFSDYFIFYKPKDIVSGDLYWISELEDYILLAVIDCTGHGVPGAMLSMVTAAFLNSVVHKKHVNAPSQVLRELYSQFNFTFTKNHTNSSANDGMDISLIEINKKDLTVRFSGVNRSLYLARNNSITEYKSYRSPSAITIEDTVNLFDTTIQVSKHDTLYLFTDGYADQFGGKEHKKLGSSKLKSFLASISEQSGSIQQNKISEFHYNWKQKEPQTDDILIIGLKL